MQETFQLRKELTCTDLQEIARAKETIRKDGRRRLVEKLQTGWLGEKTGRWTYRLIPEFATWLNRMHGEVGFCLAQALSVHGCFNMCLRRFKKRDEEMFCYCDSPVDNAKHAFFICAKWGVARSCTTSVKDFDIFPPHPNKKKVCFYAFQNFTRILSLCTKVGRLRDGGHTFLLHSLGVAMYSFSVGICP